MPYTQAQAAQFALGIREAYEEAERRLLVITTERISRGITAEGWAEQKLREVRAYLRAIRREAAQLRLPLDDIAEGLADAYEGGLDAAAAQLARAGIDDIAAGLADAERGALRAIVRETVAPLEGLPVQVLRQANDAYRRIVARTTTLELTGTITRRQAAQAALNQFADVGITGFTDAAGRRWDLASYAEMAVRTGGANAVRQGRFDRLSANGRDLVMVSDSPEECELCRPWEGRVLSISGGTPGYPAIAEARAAGLFHPGCTHDVTLYTPGLTQPPEDTENAAGYEERQEQRYLERGIRRWKKREAVAITEDAKAQAAAKKREWQGAMREFIEKTDRLRQRGREAVGAR